MTNVTASELKLLYIQIVLVAIMGFFMFLYSQSPIDQSANVQTNITSQSSVNSNDLPWSTKLVDSNLGIPDGLVAIILISSIILVPMTIMNSLTLLRLAKDVFTQWI